MFYDRLFLAGLILGFWATIKLIEEILPDKALYYLPKPLALYAVLVFVIAMIIHTVWFCLAQRRKGFFKTRFENSANQIPKISYLPSIDIFISVHNEEKVIASTIENLLGLNYSNYLIYLINDHSSDSTKETLDKYQSLFPNKIKVFHRFDQESSSGKAAALNYAFAHSNGELIAVFDADAKIESDFFLKMLPYLDNDSTGAVQSQKRISNPTANYLTKLQENEYCLDNYLQCGKDVIEGNVELRGNGQIVKREVLKSVGMWDEETLTDDLELSTRLTVLGWQIRFCPEAITLEQAPINFNSLILQRRRWAEGSLRRFLSNLLKIFGPGKETRFSQQFDAFVFLSQFAVPIWIFLDIISEIVRFLKDQETHLTSIMLISFVIWLITLINLTFGIRIYRKFSWRTSIKRAFETNLYFLTVWPLVVLLTVRKVLFSRTKGKWHRTEHYNETELNQV